MSEQQDKQGAKAKDEGLDCRAIMEDAWAVQAKIKVTDEGHGKAAIRRPNGRRLQEAEVVKWIGEKAPDLIRKLCVRVLAFQEAVEKAKASTAAVSGELAKVRERLAECEAESAELQERVSERDAKLAEVQAALEAAEPESEPEEGQ